MMGFGVMGIGMIGGMLLFWVILIVLAVFLVRGLFQSKSSASSGQPTSARQILDQRYARGEITQEQYRLMLNDIQ
jgi:putative membrane protein